MNFEHNEELKKKPYTARRIARQVLTGKDNMTVDLGKIMWVISAFSFLGITFYVVSKGGTWNPLEWASAFAIINGGGAASLKLKETTEPTAPEVK